MEVVMIEVEVQRRPEFNCAGRRKNPNCPRRRLLQGEPRRWQAGGDKNRVPLRSGTVGEEGQVDEQDRRQSGLWARGSHGQSQSRIYRREEASSPGSWRGKR